MGVGREGAERGAIGGAGGGGRRRGRGGEGCGGKEEGGGEGRIFEGKVNEAVREEGVDRGHGLDVF